MSPVVNIERFVCPPWYECPCPLGLPVSRNTMLNHRRIANERRRAMGRGKFGWGPRVPEDVSYPFNFTSLDSLAEHDSDCEDNVVNTAIGVTMGSSVHVGCDSARNTATRIHDSPPQTDRVLSNSSQAAPEVHTSGYNETNDAENSLIGGGFQESPLEDVPIYNPIMPDSAIGFGMVANTVIEGLADWLIDNQGVVDLFVKHGLEYSVMDDILVLLGSPCKSWKTVVSYICRASSLNESTETYAICPGHSCIAALGNAVAQTLFCSFCGAEGPESILSSHSKVSYLPIVPRIAAIVQEESTCEQLYAYRQNREETNGVYSDYFDGAAYQRLVSRYSEEGMKWDIFLALSADGFQPYRNKRYDVWSVISILYNLPPSVRYATKNVIPLMFIPGPKEPKDLESFLIPLINEVNSTHADDGLDLKFFDGVVRKVRIHIIWFQGDTPAVSKAAGLCGHKGRHPCRSCEIEGIYVALSRGYYFPTRISFFSPLNGPVELYDPKRLQARSQASIADAFERLSSSSNETQRSKIANETGIKRRSLLLSIPNFIPYKSFPHDTMHLLYNIQRELLSLFTGDLEGQFSLDQFSIDRIDDEITQAGRTISGQLVQRRPQGLSKWSSWKAAEHRSFFLSLCMVVLDGYLPDDYMNGLASFVQLIDLTCRPELTEDDVRRVGILAVKFLKHFENCYYMFREDRLQLCKSQYHMLLHLEESIRECGPLLCTSQYVMERSIGYQVDRINAKHLVCESLFQSSLLSESYRIFYGRLFHQDTSEVDAIISEGGLRLLGPKTICRISEYGKVGQLQEKLSRYFVRKFDGISIGQARAISNRVDFIQLFSRVQVICGSATQIVTAQKFTTVNTTDVDSKRISCFFAAEMDKTSTTCDIYYGMLQDVMEIDLVDAGPIDGLDTQVWQVRHQLILADWASKIERRRQGQVFVRGKIAGCFSGTTIEDASVVKRLVGVAEHSLPSIKPWLQNGPEQRGSQSSRTTTNRGRRMTYFVDDGLHLDQLLKDSSSLDGVNRRLKGMAS